MTPAEMRFRRSHGYRQFSRVMNCNQETNVIVVAVVCGTYSVFAFPPGAARYLQPTTQVYGPMNFVGLTLLTVVGQDMGIEVEGLTGQVPMSQAYAKFYDAGLLV